MIPGLRLVIFFFFQRSPTVECEHEGQAEVLDDSSLLNNGMYCSLRQKKKIKQRRRGNYGPVQ